MHVTIAQLRAKIHKMINESKWRKLSSYEKTTKVLPDDLQIGDWLVFRGWGTDVEPELKQVRSIDDPGFGFLLGLNTQRGFERKELAYDREVEIVERDV